MEEKLRLEKLGENRFQFLVGMGFDKVKIVTDEWFSTLSFKNKTINLSIEIHYDWRDIVVSVFIVRLKNGKDPEGYYMSEGMPCRIYLQELIQKYSWPVPKESWIYVQPDNNLKKQEVSSYLKFEKKLEHLGELLKSCINEIICEGELLFGNSGEEIGARS